MQKIHILKFWERPLSAISEYAFKYIRWCNFMKQYILQIGTDIVNFFFKCPLVLNYYEQKIMTLDK